MSITFNPEEDFPEVYKVCKLFNPSVDDLEKIRNFMDREITMGLSRDHHDRSTVPCHLSYVQDLPTGRERGQFLALEMMPTNCRIMLVKFSSENDIYTSSKCVIMPHTVAAGRGTELFNFLATSIANFVKEKKVEKENLPLGIAFAFTLKKHALDMGILVSWTKEFGAQGAIGKDVVQLLRDALAKFSDISVEVMGIINVGAGSLLGLCWAQPDTRMGLVMGSIANSCYVERVEKCELYEGEEGRKLMIINSDWAHFGDTGQLDFIRNEFDRQLDAESINPGSRIYEKFSGALCMGELVRIIVLRLMKSGSIFAEDRRDYIGIQWKLDMVSLIEIVSDPPGVYTKAQEVMDKFRIRHCKERDLAALKYICDTVTNRAAMLVASGVSCLINRMHLPEISIAVDGGIYRLHPTFAAVLNKYTRLLTDPKYKFEFVITQDSCGVGAAIMAGMAHANKYNTDAKLFTMDY
ncbi:hexokinase type 1 [Drosophila yakuba]|uniref:Phosphotransferase n=1 Tax=Drosophila yakuba TaxID=7245 RepID=B4PSG7_DROYA|nr:hexokinase type 1 [Drosophila yakuba]XP_039492786.1 hexokinase type 1 [Drosophila santomea]EDW98629.1 Hex-t1 [Drosophila yakuba]